MKDKLRNETETAFNLLQKGKKFVKSGLKIWPDPNSKSHHLRLLLLILIVLASTYLLIPRPTLPLSLMDVMEVGEIIDRDIKATRDYYIEDRQATNEKIQQAEEKIVDVYDFNLDIQDMAIKNIHRAFSPWQNYYINKDKLQAQIQEINENLAVVVKPRRGKLVEKEGEKLLSAEKYQELLKERQDNLKALEGSLALRKKEAVNYLQIKEAQFQKLAWQKFSIKMEQALVSLVRVAYRFMVLGNVTNVSEGEDSLILIRPISNYEPAGKEYQVKPKTILTITDVRRILTKEYTSLLTDIPQNEQRLILKIALNLLSPNLHFNRGETQWRRYLTRKKITPVIIPIKKGEMIIRDGEKIEQRHLLLLKGMIQESRDYNILLITLGLLGLFALLFWSSFHFGSEHVKKFKHNLKDTFLLTITFLFFLLFCKVSKEVVDALKDKFSYIPLAAYYYGIPLAAGAMAIRLLLNSETVIIFSIVLSIFAGLMFEHNIYYSLYFLVSCLVAAGSCARATQRTTLLKAGLKTGLFNMAVILFLSLMAEQVSTADILPAMIFGLLGGIGASILVSAYVPAMEAGLGYTTDIKLLELANLNHPLLKMLIVQTPGTYHHSYIVGSLAENAAEAIGANPLLARVLAYYHDIGKCKNPLYFSENQTDGANRHDKLTASISALILRAHVRDGLDMARKYQLGGPIHDAIAQHHGTSLIRYFYERAQKSRSADTPEINESDYRYGGPKPQSREVAVLMLADSIEAASRTLEEPTPARITGMVQRITNRIFSDGQFSECDLTLKDLHKIAKSFIKGLTSIHHQRPKYPQAIAKLDTDKKGRKEKEDGDPDQNQQPTKPSPKRSDDTKTEDEEDLKRLGL